MGGGGQTHRRRVYGGSGTFPLFTPPPHAPMCLTPLCVSLGSTRCRCSTTIVQPDSCYRQKVDFGCPFYMAYIRENGKRSVAMGFTRNFPTILYITWACYILKVSNGQYPRENFLPLPLFKLLDDLHFELNSNLDRFLKRSSHLSCEHC